MKQLISFVILFSGIAAARLFSQQSEVPLEYDVMYKEAERLYDTAFPTVETDQKAIELFTAVYDQLNRQKGNIHDLINCAKKIGDLELGGGNYKQAIKYYKRVIDVNLSSGKTDSVYDYQAKLYLGSAYYHSNIIDSARYYFEQAALYARYAGNLPDISFLYNSLGVIYFESANYLQAKNYFEQAFPKSDNLIAEDPETYISLSTNVATCLKFLDREADALQIYRSLLPLTSSREKLYYNIANTYLLLNQFDSALWYYEKIVAPDNITAVKRMNDIGRVYTETGKWINAEKAFDSAITLNHKHMFSPKNKELAYSYLYKAMLAEKQGLTDEAIFWCNNGLQVLHFDFRWQNPADLPDDETRVISHPVFFEILRKKAELFATLYKQDGEEEMAEVSLKTYMKAIRLASFIKASFDNDDARIFFKKNHNDIYNKSIAVAYELILHKNKRAKDHFLQIMESYKGSVLYQNLLEVEIKRTTAIEPAVLEQEKRLKQSLAAYTARLNNNSSTEDIPDLQKRIIELEVEISRLQKVYEDYPEYKLFRRQSDANYVTIDAVRNQLDDYTVVISFMQTGTDIYGIAITSGDFVVKKIELDSNLNKNISQYISALYEHTNGRRFSGHESSSKIYQGIIAPFENIAGNKKRWVILPDGILNFIPFNTLQEFPDEHHYLAESKIISNHYSLMLLLNDDKKTEVNTRAPVIFAPFINETTRKYLPELPTLFSSGIEVKAVKGKSYTAAQATKTAFLAVANKSPVIHLATHASSDIDSNSNSYIYFYPSDSSLLNSRLYSPEIYSLDLHNTRLVILSACETASGQNSSGEGLLSLARAFLYAGSDGVVSTFWKTEDKVSGYIMQRFHFHLQQLKSPDEALFLAKNDFLQNKDFDEHYKTPNYWGNFIYIGNLNTLTSIGPNVNTLTSVVLGLLVMSFLVVSFIISKRDL